jgi:hypothetical protein
MKKIGLLVFMVLAMISSCKRTEEKYKVYYTVYYPNNTKHYIVIIDDTPYLGSDRGTNFLNIGGLSGANIISTSAPIEIEKTIKIK